MKARVRTALHDGSMNPMLMAKHVNADERLVHRGRFVETTLLLECGDDAWLVRVDRGRIDVTPGPFVMARSRFALRASADAWASLLAPHPAPGSHDVMALVKRRVLKIEGDPHPFFANLQWFKDVLGTMRGVE